MSGSVYDLSNKLFSLQNNAPEKLSFPKRLFRHDDILKKLESAVPVNQKKLINIINLLHFKGDYLLVHLKDCKYGEDFFIHAYPEPCLGELITCRLSFLYSSEIENHIFMNLVILDGLSIIFIPVQIKSIENDNFTIALPDRGYCLGTRQSMRYNCQDVIVEISQSGFIAKGDLIDFSPNGFRIKALTDQRVPFLWLNPENNISINLYKKQQLLYSGVCRFIRQTDGHLIREIVLLPIDQQIKRFRRGKTRTPRLRMTPSPSIVFEHPFIKKIIQRDIHDISFGGFSVYEDSSEGVLIPGLILTELYIIFSGGLKLKCVAQITSRRKSNRSNIRYGLTILDMDFPTYSRLIDIITNTIDPHVHISEDVDMDALWEFLFNANFIYAKKYHHIHSHREEFKETYNKLYQHNSKIAAHLTYQYQGKIYGHTSIIRAYDHSWMVHHLAARPIGKKHKGLSVLRQILYYFYGFYRLPSMQIDYLLFYFRPDNRFPNLFFGGAARKLNNPRACSLDLFSYNNYIINKPCSLPAGWSLKEYSEKNNQELERFYRNHSGGLLLDHFLSDYNKNNDPQLVEKLYEQCGLLRKWKLYALTYIDQLKAVFIIDQANIGVNLSELLNSIKIIVTDPTNLPWPILSCAIDQTAVVYNTGQIPVMIYPHFYLKEQNIPYEKSYMLLILDVQYATEFLDNIQDIAKINLTFIIKYIIQKYIKHD
jgi:hypothetical protein